MPATPAWDANGLALLARHHVAFVHPRNALPLVAASCDYFPQIPSTSARLLGTNPPGQPYTLRNTYGLRPTYYFVLPRLLANLPVLLACDALGYDVGIRAMRRGRIATASK
jgi:hypothetical protein